MAETETARDSTRGMMATMDSPMQLGLEMPALGTAPNAGSWTSREIKTHDTALDTRA